MDPVCTFLFSIFVLITTISIMQDILIVLMEGKSFCLSVCVLASLPVDRFACFSACRQVCLLLFNLGLSAALMVSFPYQLIVLPVGILWCIVPHDNFACNLVENSLFCTFYYWLE